MSTQDKHFVGYRVKVELSASQDATHSQVWDLHGKIQHQVIHLKEEMTRKALIQAGWTPPDLRPAKQRAMYACSHCGYLYGGEVTRCDCMPEGEEQRFEEWVAHPKDSDSLLQAVLRCRYPVCKTINSKGHDWDWSRLDEVIDDAIKGEG